MRELSQLLRPPGLEVYGLGASLESDLRAFGQRHALATTFDADGVPEHLPAKVETAVYRIAQEALTNVARHEFATRVQVPLRMQRGERRLEVKDDGVGLPPDGGTEHRGTGLVGIRERLRSLGGTLALTSSGGARLTARVPLGASRFQGS